MRAEDLKVRKKGKGFGGVMLCFARVESGFRR
jgi:hypothetical protein